MNLRITASALFLYLICASLFAQNGAPCSRDYSLLSYSINLDLGELTPDQELFLSDAYLEKHASGEFEKKPSETKYFEYLRPASKKEIKQGIENGGKFETLFGDGNVYGLNFLPPHFHFFSPRPGFEGSLAGKWEDPYLVLPIGLEPVLSKSLSGVKLRVLESNTDYVLMEAEGNSYVFYPGSPDLEEVFIPAEAVEQMEGRQAMLETFIGQRFFLENHPSLRYRNHPEGEDLYLDEDNPGMEIAVTDVVASAHEVLLYCGKKNEVFVVLDEFSAFKISDLDCIETENQSRWASYEDEFGESNTALNELINSGEEIIDIFENQWVVELLQGRFRLHQDLHAAKAEYECLYLQDPESYLSSFLSAHVDQEGEIYLQSQYSSEKGLYHTKIELLYEGEEMASDRIRALDPRSSRIRKDDRVIERIDFRGGADNGILETIAKNSDKEFMIRFTAGGSYYEDVTLLQKYKDAIRDMWLLSQFLKNQDALNARIRGDK